MDQQLPPVSLAQVFDRSLELSGGDAFRALAIAHEVLRHDRLEGNRKFKTIITDLRGDGHDELGARYHYLGMAIYGFWYQHLVATATDNSEWYVTAPELTAFLEEHFVSNDLGSDPGEYVVDVAGGQFGRELYWSSRGEDVSGVRPCDLVLEGSGLHRKTTYRSADDYTLKCELQPRMTLVVKWDGSGTFTHWEGSGSTWTGDGGSCTTIDGTQFPMTHDAGRFRIHTLPAAAAVYRAGPGSCSASPPPNCWDAGGSYTEAAAGKWTGEGTGRWIDTDDYGQVLWRRTTVLEFTLTGPP